MVKTALLLLFAVLWLMSWIAGFSVYRRLERSRARFELATADLTRSKKNLVESQRSVELRKLELEKLRTGYQVSLAREKLLTKVMETVVDLNHDVEQRIDRLIPRYSGSGRRDPVEQLRRNLESCRKQLAVFRKEKELQRQGVGRREFSEDVQQNRE